jgi:hypothetical protein
MELVICLKHINQSTVARLLLFFLCYTSQNNKITDWHSSSKKVAGETMFVQVTGATVVSFTYSFVQEQQRSSPQTAFYAAKGRLTPPHVSVKKYTAARRLFENS